jgi:short-subunit dehydrogenase
VRARALGAAPGDEPPDPPGTLTAEGCAARIVEAMERRRRELLLPASAKALQAARLVAPGLVDRLVARRIEGR